MSEWWTYTLSDFLLFSPRTYYRLFELYNADIWPIQFLGIVLGGVIFDLLARGGAHAARISLVVLAASWLFIAWAFHLERYATINWAAVYAAAAFALQALLLLATAWRGRMQLEASPLLIILAFALVIQPLIGPLLGRPWSQIELLGTAPDPTAVATLALVAMARNRIYWELLIVPLLWCTVSGATLWTMGAPDALVTPAAAVAALLAALWRPATRGA